MSNTEPTLTAGFAYEPRRFGRGRGIALTPAGCNLDFWLERVAQGTLAGLVGGHRPDAHVPAYMLEPGALRSSLIEEFAFRSMAEQVAARSAAYLVQTAPDNDTLEFFATQVIDESRHARVFRGHILELAIPEPDLPATMERAAGEEREIVLAPLSKLIDELDGYVEGLTLVTVLVEEVVAPFTELTGRKWRKLDPAAADIARGVDIDEIRHRTVGATVLRRHLQEHPEDRARLVDFIARGRRLWKELPVTDALLARERRFQEGLDECAEIAGDYELELGLRLADSTPEERVQLALTWWREVQESRMTYMGLEEALAATR
jgi:hypothetical protein